MGTEHSAPAQFSDVPELPLPEPVILAIELVGYEVGQRAFLDRLVRTLEKEEVRKAMEHGLDAAAHHIVRKSTWTPPGQMSEAQKEEIFQRVMKSATDPLKNDFLAQFKNSWKTRMVQESAARFVQNIGGGVFTDHKWLFIIGGVATLVGGSAAMWYARSGDAVTDPLTKLLGSQIPTVEIGRLKFDTEIVQFVPSSREVKAKLAATGQWERLQAKVSLTGLYQNGQSRLTGNAQLTVPVHVGDGEFVNWGVAARAGTRKDDLAVAAGFTFKTQIESAQLEISLWASYGNKLHSSPAAYRPGPDKGSDFTIVETLSVRF